MQKTMSAAPATRQLTATGVSVAAGGRNILDQVTLDLRPGEVTVVVGPNGAGKSTLLSVLAGDVQPTSGSVRLGGRELRRWKPVEAARERAVMTQESAVSFPFPTCDVVAMGRAAWHRTPRQDDDEEVINSSMAATEVAHLSDRAVTVLSGGERQRAALARVLAQEGSIILLDEPVSAMDIAHQEKTLRTCRSLAAHGAAVVVVLHDLDAAAAYADRVVLLREGRIVRDGSVQEVCTPELLSEVYGTPIEVFRLPGGGRLRVAPTRNNVEG